MSVEKRTKTITVEWWHCGVCKKEHKTREAAEECLRKKEKREANVTYKTHIAGQEWTPEQLLSLREDFKCAKDVANALGVRLEQARSLLRRGTMLRNHKLQEEYKLDLPKSVCDSVLEANRKLNGKN